MDNSSCLIRFPLTVTFPGNVNLSLDSYCDGCMSFEPVKDEIEFTQGPSSYKHYYISCSHMEACKTMYKRINEEKNS